MKIIVEVEQRKDELLDTVLIGLDREALHLLIQDLRRLETSKVGEHVPLMSEEWGPGDLIARPRQEGNLPIHHLRIDLVA